MLLLLLLIFLDMHIKTQGKLAHLSEPDMSDDISVIVEAAVQRIKREISEETKNLLESDDIQRHLGDSKLDFEVLNRLVLKFILNVYFHSLLSFI